MLGGCKIYMELHGNSSNDTISLQYTTEHVARVELARLMDEMDRCINTNNLDSQIIEKKLTEINTKIDKIYYSPNMPGYYEAENQFKKDTL